MEADLRVIECHAGTLTRLNLTSNGAIDDEASEDAAFSYLSDTFTCLHRLVLDCLDQQGFRSLGHLSRLHSLQILNLAFWRGRGSWTCCELARITSLASLTIRTPSVPSVPTEEAEEDLHLSALTGLTQLSVTSANVTMGLLARFATMKHMRSLSLIRMERPMRPTGPAEDAELVHVAGMTDLRDLNLSVGCLDGWGLSHLAPLTCLTCLDIGLTRGDICHAAALTGLRRLSLEGLTRDYGVDTDLPPLSALPSLTCLRLKYYKLDSDFAAVGLAQMAQLEKVSLYRCKLQHGALRQLSALECLGHLRVMECSEFNVCMPDVARAAGLEKLTLRACGVNVEGLSHLRALPCLRQLKLQNWGNRHGDWTYQGLAAFLPKLCRVLVQE